MEENVGTIVISTKVDNSEATRKLLELQKQAELLNNELENLENVKLNLEQQWEKAGEGAKKYKNEIADITAKIEKDQQYIATLEEIGANITLDPDQANAISLAQGRIEQYKNEIGMINNLIAEELQGQDKIGLKIDEQIAKIERKKLALEKVNDKLDIAREKMELESESSEGMNFNFSKIEKNAGKVADKFTGILKKVGKIALALLGVRTIINLITRSFNTLAQYNEELGTKMEQMRLVLAAGLEPIINWLVSMLHTILSLVNQISIALAGIDLFGRASELWSKKMAKNMGSGASSAKEMKKQLAGFDEMNVLTDTNSGSGGGGGGSTAQEWTLQPMFDWSKFDIHTIMDKAKEMVDGLIKGINNFLQNVSPEEIADGISTFIIGTLEIITKTFRDLDWQQLGKTFIEVLTSLDWVGIVKALIENIVYSLVWPIDLLLGLIDGLVEFFEGPDCASKMLEAGAEMVLALMEGLWTLIKKIVELTWKVTVIVTKFVLELVIAILDVVIEYGAKIINWIKDALKKAWDWVKSLFTTIKNIYIQFNNAIYNVFLTIINWVLEKIELVKAFFKGFIDGIKLSIQMSIQWIKDRIQDIYNFFYNIIVGIQTTVGNVVQWIKDKFNTFVNFFKGIGIAIGDFFSGAIKGAVNGVLSWVESKVNWFIDKINSVINLINKIPGVSIGRLSRISLPRLAVGGIINQPGRGVPVGGAIAGERGREGILPLTDRQAMAELGKEIGKWININATIPVNIGNRQVARVIQELNNDREFAMNS